MKKIKQISHLLTTLSIYEEQDSLTLVEIFESRGMDIRKDNICLQIFLSKKEVEELVECLKTKIS